MRRIGKGFSRVETPLFEGMLVVREDVEADIREEQIPDDTAIAAAQEVITPAVLEDTALDACATLTLRVKHLEHAKEAQTLEITQLKKRVKKLERVNNVKTFKLRRLKKVGTSQRVETSDDTIMEDVSNQGRMIVELDRDEGVELIEVQEAVEVVTTAKLITEVVNAASTPVSVASTIIPTAKQNIPAVTIIAALVKDKGKGIFVEEPKPIKKKQQVEIDEAYARKLHEELNQDIDWDVAIDHVKQKVKEDPFIQRYQVMKKRPQTEAQARRNMIMYLKNTVGFKLDYFKRKSYNDICPIFKAKFNTNMKFLLKSKEKIEEEESRALESINETPAQKAAKRRRLNQEDKDMEEIKQHLEIVPDEDDNVYTEATPLAKKVPVVDYQIILLNNKPRYKIIQADGTHQLYASFITVLKKFDRDDLETLWSIVKERFSTSKPNNFSDEYLLTTLMTMFGRPDGQDNVWKSQRSVHGQAMVKSWKLLTSCGVYIISFTTTQLIFLVERRYPLSRFTLEQMLNVVRLQVEEQSEMSMELIRHPAIIEGYSDANWISNIKDSRSTNGYVFTLGGAAISWKSSKQTVIAKSTMELGFIALDKCREEAKWLRQFVEDIPRVA
nr:zinc finger, CCHC-type [Tanacetum cinerariifolium]